MVFYIVSKTMSSLNKNRHSSFNFCNPYKIAHNVYPIYRSLCFAGQAVGIKKYTVEDPVFHGAFCF